MTGYPTFLKNDIENSDRELKNIGLCSTGIDVYLGIKEPLQEAFDHERHMNQFRETVEKIKDSQSSTQDLFRVLDTYEISKALTSSQNPKYIKTSQDVETIHHLLFLPTCRRLQLLLKYSNVPKEFEDFDIELNQIIEHVKSKFCNIWINMDVGLVSGSKC